YPQPSLTTFPTRRSSDLSPDEPPRESLSKYLAFAHAHPDLFKNPAHGGFSIVLDKREIREAEARTAELLGSSQGSADWPHVGIRSEEHTSELQSPDHLVC